MPLALRVLLYLIAMFAPVAVHAQNWPQFRGLRSDGAVDAAGLPLVLAGIGSQIGGGVLGGLGSKGVSSSTGGTGSNSVNFKIQGKDLVGTLNRYNNYNSLNT